MKIEIINIGKTSEKELNYLVDKYLGRLKHYITCTYNTLPDIKNVKNLSVEQLKQKEGTIILKNISPKDYLILLDERGKQFTSREFADFLSKKMLSGIKKLIFVIGGAYGFSEEVYDRADMKISLSPMTFSHQMVRLFFVEQLYRAYTIIRGESYHHD
jgi:23S rRNA (pseudouridine1915-N3)-methyltransferase